MVSLASSSNNSVLRQKDIKLLHGSINSDNEDWNVSDQDADE